jgi:Ser/Thr protein kinase RdoA (MazF antagonist)
MPVRFSELTTEEQIQSLVEPATRILAQYEIFDFELKNIAHEYNSTFSVSTPTGEKFALRINVNSNRNESNLAAEMTFLNTLAQSGRFRVADPIRNLAGEFVTKTFHAANGKDLLCVLFAWLEGEDVGDEPTLEVIYQMGVLMAHLHEMTKNLVLASGEELPSLDDFMWHVEDYLLGEKSTLSMDDKAKIATGRKAIEAELKGLFVANQMQPIHADLHGWNLKINDGELSVFDFDDAGIGLPLQDLATAIYYLDTDEEVKAIKAGYESVRQLPSYSENQMKALLLQRRIHLLNYLYETQNPEHREMLPEYQAETFQRIDDFMSS